MFETMDLIVNNFWKTTSNFTSKHIDEDDFAMEWEEFSKKHPLITREDYEQAQKEIQEV